MLKVHGRGTMCEYPLDTRHLFFNMGAGLSVTTHLIAFMFTEHSARTSFKIFQQEI